jgi:hypothetical protein
MPFSGLSPGKLQHRIQPPSWPPLQSRIFGEGFLSLDGIGFVIPAPLEFEGLESKVWNW